MVTPTPTAKPSVTKSLVTWTRQAFEQQCAALEADAGFARLAAVLREFNTFEALGVVRHELRHSAVLAFLLHPRQSHGLGDAFVREFFKALPLRRALLAALSTSSLTEVTETTNARGAMSTAEFNALRFEQMIVFTEWSNIDILLVDDSKRLAVIIENKIDSEEHDDQLSRYWQQVCARYPQYVIVGVYLTPTGEAPRAAPDMPYVALSYDSVLRAVTALTRRRQRSTTLTSEVASRVQGKSKPDAAVGIFLHHYLKTLRRYIVADAVMKQLCESLYRKHQLLLDEIYRYRPDEQETVLALLLQLVEASRQPRLMVKSRTKHFPKFTTKEWEALSDKATLSDKAIGGEKAGKAVLYFEFTNRGDLLKLNLIIGPAGSTTVNELRQRILDTALAHPDLFKVANTTLNQNANSIWGRTLIARKDYSEMSGDDREAEIKRLWEQFLREDLPRLCSALAPKQLNC